MTGKVATALPKKLVVFFIRLVCLAATLATVAYLVDLDKLWPLLWAFPLWGVFVAVAIVTFRAWLTSLRWCLLNPDPTGHLSSWDYFRYMMISKTFNLFMPGALGGDIIRSVMVVRSVKQHRGSNLFAILADRVVGLFSILVLGTVACIFAPGLPERWKHLAFLLTLMAVFLATVVLASSGFFHRMTDKLLRKMGTLGQSGIKALNSWQYTLAYYRANRGRTCLALLLCLPIHVSWFCIVFLLAHWIDVNVSFLSICMVSALVWVISAVPLTFAGLGVRELSFVYLLGLQGVGSAQATALSLYQFGIVILSGLVGLGFLLANPSTPREGPEDQGPVATDDTAAVECKGTV